MWSMNLVCLVCLTSEFLRDFAHSPERPCLTTLRLLPPFLSDIHPSSVTAAVLAEICSAIPLSGSM